MKQPSPFDQFYDQLTGFAADLEHGLFTLHQAITLCRDYITAAIPQDLFPPSEHLVQQLRSLQYLLSELRPALIEFVRLGIPRHTQLRAIPMVYDRIRENRKAAMRR